MISLAGYQFFIWGVFAVGWLGVGVIAVAAILELVKMFRAQTRKTN